MCSPAEKMLLLPSLLPVSLSKDIKVGVISEYTDPGGDIYRAHVFNSTGSFNVSSVGSYDSTIDYLVVAGGGSGGNEGGGGAVV